MDWKGLWQKIVDWLKTHRFSGTPEYLPTLNDDGLISACSSEAGNNPLAVKTVPSDKGQSLEKLEAGFEKFINQLQGINDNLSQHINQQENLIKRLDNLPKLLESFPVVADSQKQLTEKLLEELKINVTKQQQFIDVVSKIPAETSRQTNALSNIDHQLAAAAEADAQMVHSLNKFNESMENLNKNAMENTDGLLQMNRTFSASERYLKYLLHVQSKRFMWILVGSLSLCMLAILILAGIIIYVK